MEYVAFDSHKRYTFASVEEHAGAILRDARIEYQRGAVKEFLSERKEGTPEAIETIGNWHWIVDEIDKAGMVPQLDHARRAKMMLVSVNKTDKLLAGRGTDQFVAASDRVLSCPCARIVVSSCICGGGDWHEGDREVQRREGVRRAAGRPRADTWPGRGAHQGGIRRDLRL